MRNKAILFLTIIIAGIFVSYAPVDAASWRIAIDGRTLSEEVGPILTVDGFIVPIDLAIIFGAELTYQGSVYVIRTDRDIMTLTPGDVVATTKLGRRVLPWPSVELGTTLYVPLQFFADYFGLKMKWDWSRHTVDISRWTSFDVSHHSTVGAARTIDDALRLIDIARGSNGRSTETPELLLADASLAGLSMIANLAQDISAEVDAGTDETSRPIRLDAVWIEDHESSASTDERPGTSVEASGKQIAASIANLLNRQPVGQSGDSPQIEEPIDDVSTPAALHVITDGPDVPPTDAAATRDSLADSVFVSDEILTTNETLGTTGATASIWPRLSEITGLSLQEERVGGLIVHRFIQKPPSGDRLNVKSSLLVDPFRLVVDIDGIQGAFIDPLVVEDSLIEKIRGNEFEGGLRLVYDIKTGVGHEIIQDDTGNITVMFYQLLDTIDVQNGEAGGRIGLSIDPDTPFQLTHLPDPDRWIIDLARTTVDVRDNQLSPGAGVVQRIRVAQHAPETTRIVLDMRDRSDVEIAREEGGLAIYYGNRLAPLAYRIVADDEIHIGIHSDEPVEPTILRLGRPDRLVIDIPGLVWPDQPYEQIFMDGPVTRLRSSQYDEKTIRVVADLRHHVQYGVVKEESRVVVMLKRPSLSERKVVVDAGHGGIDGGAVGRYLGVLEKDVNLDISLKLSEMINQLGGVAYLSRKSDVFHDLWSRPAMANDIGADVFVSIHSNTAEGSSPTATGSEIYVNMDRADALRLGTVLQDSLVSAIGTRDRGVRQNRYLVVREATMPAALVEVAFLSNREEEELLSEDWFRKRAAEGLLNGLLRYFHPSDQLDVGQLKPREVSLGEWTSVGRGNP